MILWIISHCVMGRFRPCRMLDNEAPQADGLSVAQQPWSGVSRVPFV